MNILISGATGFVGRHLVPVLQQGGNKLICIVRDKKKAVELFGEQNNHDSLIPHNYE